MSRVYMAARYDKGSADYVNCPMTPEEYGRFYDALLSAQSVEERGWENLNYFEGCLPSDESASARFVCRTDLRSRRLRGIDCNRIDGGSACGGPGARRCGRRSAAGFR